MLSIIYCQLLILTGLLTRFQTCPKVEEIKTVQTIAEGDFMKLPVIGKWSDSSLEISFDYLTDEQQWLTYTIVHCDAEWKPDDLDVMEYADGFFPVRITDVKPSFNTFVPYFHYTIRFPNEDVSLSVSGNYAVLIHPEDDEDKVLAVAVFSVSEQLAFIDGHVDGNTDISFNKSHQQLGLDLSWNQNRLPFVDPASQFKLIVCQNRRYDTRRVLTMPTRVGSGHAIYEHNRDLIFDAGNNYRRFELTDVRYASMGVDHIGYESPYYIAQLLTDKPRNNNAYLYDQDQNGRFLVRALHTGDDSVEAEYVKTRFILDAPSLSNSNGIYLQGDLSYGLYSEDYRMEYDSVCGLFCKDLILKQGAYNYQYVVDGSISAIEGSYYETPNEYDVYVYYRPNGARYDRLLGVATIYSDNDITH